MEQSITSHAMSPPASRRMVTPTRWWLYMVLCFVMFTWNALIPSKTPPGWPIYDNLIWIFFIPVAAAVMSYAGSTPPVALGIYGGATCFLMAIDQQGDGRFRLSLNSKTDIYWWIVFWCVHALTAYFICRSMVYLRRLQK